jgi:hypothetical protein
MHAQVDVLLLSSHDVKECGSKIAITQSQKVGETGNEFSSEIVSNQSIK